MLNPFLHPSGEGLLDRIKHAFATQRVFEKPTRQLVFVCGGPIDGAGSVRENFLAFARANLSNYRVLLAELAAEDLRLYNDDSRFTNLAEFESLVAEIAHCIVIFPESDGSRAELGFFAGTEAVRKILVANNRRYQSRISFINHGPISLVSRRSMFGQVLWIDYDAGDQEFEHIAEVLTNRIPPLVKGKRLRYAGYRDLSARERLFVVFEILAICRAQTVETTVYCLDKVFGNADREEVRHLISILLSAGYLRRLPSDSNFVAPGTSGRSFIEFRGFELGKLTAAVVGHYQEHFPDIYQLMDEVRE